MVLYGAFVGGLCTLVGYVLYTWLMRVGGCYVWTHHSVLEVLWTVVPVVFLALALVHGVAVLYAMEGVKGDAGLS